MRWYDHQSIEKKWQERWAHTQPFRAQDFSKKEKYFLLIEFPFTSGDGLHVGHVRSYTALDALARMKRMQGKNVLYPIGYDAFGLPTENYALKTGRHPREITDENIANFRRQMQALGLSFDWSREVDTADPQYYRWTQWIFLQLYKKGLAYRATMPINWCPKDKIGLANEEVAAGKCERCGADVIKKEQTQWLLKITAYAERLLRDLGTVDYLEKIKTQQVNWIGRSEGAEIQFKIRNEELRMKKKVLLATNNPSKVGRIRTLVARAMPSVSVVTPGDIGLPSIEVNEGSDLAQNAEAKARAYFQKTDLPIIGMDTGLFIDGVQNDPAKVKRNALGDADASSLSPEEIGSRMNAYYRKIATSRGGEVPGYFLDALALLQPDGTVHRATAKREIVLTDRQKGEMDPHFPIRCLYRIKATGKYAAEQTEDEEINKDLLPLTDALMSLLSPSVSVFTTRPETIFGATYLVLSPEHSFVQNYELSGEAGPGSAGQMTNYKEVRAYIERSRKKSDLERTDLAKEKTGVELKGIRAINPASGEEIPIWVADYVLPHYGTGAVMAVPAHDERDWDFAKEFGLPIRTVITSPKNCVMVHGCPKDEKSLINVKEDTDKHWIPWIRKELRKIDCNVLNPLMPEAWNPNYEKWKAVMDTLHIDENTILVGHSCGGAFLVRWLSENKKHIRKLILVAAAKIVADDASEEKKSFYDFSIDPLLHNRIHETVVFIGTQDKERHQQSARMYAQALNGRLVELSYRGHFSSADMVKTNAFPELLKEILRDDMVFVGEGTLVNSGQFDGMESSKAITSITSWLEEKGTGEKAVTYKLRDWIFSRQHYWGEPIPVVHCAACKKTVETEAHELRFRDAEVWERLKTGRKTVETRALNPDEPERHFANITDGAYLRCVFVPTGETLYFRVAETWIFKNLEDFFKHREIVRKLNHGHEYQNVHALADAYAFTHDYAERIEQNGLIAWEIEHVIPGVVPVPESQLPVELPYVKKYEPANTGESPLANAADWVRTQCPQCGGPATRETDTMPNWAGSSWYYLRYCDPRNESTLADIEKLRYWLPVDLYNGGMEHTTLHVLYSRFWHKFLFDHDLVPHPEPYRRRHSHGLVIAEDGRKMSKSFGNVVSPDDLIREYGADSVRTYEMFMGPFEDTIPWSTRGIIGVHRFLQNVHDLVLGGSAPPGAAAPNNLTLLVHRTIKRVTEDLAGLRFNTAVAALMEMTNALRKIRDDRSKEYQAALKTLLLLLFPFAPHLASELWEQTHGGDIGQEPWPTCDESVLAAAHVTLVVQVNGKVRAKMHVQPNITQGDALQRALAEPNVSKYVTGVPKKVVFVAGRLMNLIV